MEPTLVISSARVPCRFPSLFRFLNLFWVLLIVENLLTLFRRRTCQNYVSTSVPGHGHRRRKKTLVRYKGTPKDSTSLPCNPWNEPQKKCRISLPGSCRRNRLTLGVQGDLLDLNSIGRGRSFDRVLTSESSSETVREGVSWKPKVNWSEL